MRKIFFAPLGWLYGGIIAVRNWIYDSGMAPSHTVSVPVIGIGNITTGGSGKTPCAILALELLLNAGRRPAMISRGYGRRSQGTVIVSNGKSNLVSVQDSGDEPMLVAQRFPGVIVVVAERRIDAARAAMGLGADCIVADDAFQHRALFREIDIVMTGDELTHRAHYLLPVGNGREPLRSLHRADLIISTSHAEADVKRSAARWSAAPLIFADVAPTAVVNPFTGTISSIEELRGRSMVLLTGIAHPDRVSASLKKLGATIASVHSFADHHWFTADELRVVAAAAASAKAIVITTEKDWVRLSAVPESSLFFRELELRVLRVALQMRHPGDEFSALIHLQLHE